VAAVADTATLVEKMAFTRIPATTRVSGRLKMRFELRVVYGCSELRVRRMAKTIRIATAPP
jgi:hypothetical protein